MSEDVIHFSCEACQAKLTVPSKLAGVEGPCPKCGATIRAPQAEPEPPTPVAPEPAAAPPQEPAPAEKAATCRRPDSLPERRSQVVPVQESEQERIRPEPRELPDREERASVSPRHSTEDVARRPEPRAERASPAPQPQPGIRRFLVPVGFLIIGAVLAYVLLHSFLGDPVTPPAGADGQNPGSSGSPATPSEGNAPIANGSGESNGGAVPLPEETPDPADGVEAEDVLRDFLRASSIGARLPLIEPTYEREALVGSVIDTPLLSADRITPDAPIRNSLENFVDHPFRVRFESVDEDPINTLVIVRKRAGQRAKLLIDPLLDLLGGRLEQYAAKPVQEPQTFRAVIEAMPRCFEEGIPDPENKITYKLSSSTHGGEIARAYASKVSPLAEMLYSPDSELRWGKRIPATVTLRWNVGESAAGEEPAEATDDPATDDEAPVEGAPPADDETTSEDPSSDDAPADTESPSQPYLELIEIRSLDWSP